jgi:hypothetical protein
VQDANGRFRVHGQTLRQIIRLAVWSKTPKSGVLSACGIKLRLSCRSGCGNLAIA